MIGDSRSSQRELSRIQWRQVLLSDPAGCAWLAEQASNRKTKERDLGPHRFIPGVTERLFGGGI